MNLTHSFNSLQGERLTNEDTHVIFTNLNGNNTNFAKVDLYSIYDGHGGSFVSKYLQKILHCFLIDNRLEYPLEQVYVNKAFKTVQDILTEKHEKSANEAGSTALIAIFFKKDSELCLQVLNTGDSRAVLCNKYNIAVPLTKDHKPDLIEEKNRIEKLGGSIVYDEESQCYRIGDLAVSRAFGDNTFKKYVTETPEIFNYKIQPGCKFIVLACDGLWDVMENGQVVEFILEQCYDLNSGKYKNDVNISKLLAEKAIEKGSTDNVSVIVIFFN